MEVSPKIAAVYDLQCGFTVRMSPRAGAFSSALTRFSTPQFHLRSVAVTQFIVITLQRRQTLSLAPTHYSRAFSRLKAG